MAKRKTRAVQNSRIPGAGESSASAQDVDGALKRAVAAHQAGDLVTAEQGYRAVLDRAPENPYALHFTGVMALQKGDPQKAAELIEQAVAAVPRFADAWSNLGAAYHALERKSDAERAFRQAIELNPGLADALSNLAAILNGQGKHAEAADAYRRAHEAAPSQPKFLKRLGDLALEAEQFDVAIDWFNKFLGLAEDDGEVSNNIGYAMERLSRTEEAAEWFGKAKTLKPTSPEILNNLGSALGNLGRYAEADACLQEALKYDSGSWENTANLARTYANRRDMDRALPLFEMLIEQQPDDAELVNDYGFALSMDGRHTDAEAQFLRSVAIKPDYAVAYNNLGTCRVVQNRRGEAIDDFKKAVAVDPSYLAPLFNICMALTYMGRFEEAYIYARAAVMHDDFTADKFANPNKVLRRLCDFDSLDALGDPWELVKHLKPADAFVTFLEMLIVADTDDSIEALSALHRGWGDNVVSQTASNPLPPAVPGIRRSKLRLGIMSSDLRQHSVAKFVRPLLENYDQDDFEIFCYSPTEEPNDPVQQHIKTLVADFRLVQNMTDRKLAEEIRADGIDILFELNGFTRDSRIKALAYKAAPVQASWLGYPFSSGIGTVDYIMVDPHLKPLNEDWMVEKFLVMPEACWCFDGFEPEPISERPPMERNGVVTFGSQNNPYKFTRKTIALWCEVMNKVPGSRFLLVRPEADSPVLCSHLIKEFGRNGIEPDRLYFVNNRRLGISNLAYYDEMDITLDTFPLTGGTTTCEVIWMGLPVVSKVGPSMHQRLSHTVLANVGLGELSVETDVEYVEAAVGLANDPDSLALLRRELRGALERSALCRAVDYAGNFCDQMRMVAKRHGLR
ncbi:MAG: protein O-GlcNAc transferase [Alphaproteobacteria bacterium]|jgi:protein O-GlcNAc transferase